MRIWGAGPVSEEKKAAPKRKNDVKNPFTETRVFRKERLGLENREPDPTRDAKPRMLGLQNQEGVFQQKAHIYICQEQRREDA